MSAASEHSSKSHIIKHLPLKDISGNTLTVVEIRTPRDISMAGGISIRNAMLFLSIAILVTIMLSWLALRQLMVQPLLSLKRHVSYMRETGDLTAGYHASVKDEVGTLADEIDFLAGNLDMSRTQLTLARDQAESASRAKSEFLAAMSHELRTPLNGVIGMADILMRSELTHQQQCFVEAVMSSGQSLLKLIDDILNFSNMSSGHMEISNVSFSVETLLQEVSAVASAAAQENGLRYQMLSDNKLPDTIVADRQRLKQVLLNLLDNAVKFTHSGEVVLSIDCLDRNDGDDSNALTLSFAVRDTGVGIEEENIGSIFDTFSQADGSTTREFGGSGLGLSISKGLVEMMGGGITVRSVYGEGSEFRFIVQARNETLAATDDERSA
jgi:signal transduction histidine kinase